MKGYGFDLKLSQKKQEAKFCSSEKPIIAMATELPHSL